MELNQSPQTHKARKVKKLFTLFILICAWSANASTFGLHLLSTHIPDGPGLNNQNAGAYVRFDNGLTTGGYRNTINRNSFYLGYTAESGPFSLTVGGITGYQKQRRPVSCIEFEGTIKPRARNCWYEVGRTNAVVAPMIVPSVALPAFNGANGQQITPRLSFMPGIGKGSGGSVIHLSIEAKL